MGFHCVLLLLLLLKGKVQVERQFLFKEVNFKYCCQTKKETKLEPVRQLSARVCSFPVVRNFCIHYILLNCKNGSNIIPFTQAFLRAFCSTHSVIMIKYIKVCFYFSTEMGINWCRCERRFLSKLFLHFFSPLLLTAVLELRWWRASYEWIRMQVMMERCVITLNGQLPLAWINEGTFTVAVHRDFETLRYPERFCNTPHWCQVNWAH